MPDDEKIYTEADLKAAVEKKFNEALPARLKGLNDKIEKLEAEKAEISTEKDALKTKVEELESSAKSEITKANERTEKVEKELADMKAAAEKREKYDSGLKEINSKVSEAQLGKGAAEYVAVNFRPGDDPVKFLETDRKSTRLNSSHRDQSRMPSSA